MKKIIENIKKNLKTYIWTFIISTLVGLGVFLFFYFFQKQTYVGALNGAGVAFAALFGIGILCWLGRFGAYDTMSYGFVQMITSMFGKEANKHNDFSAYKQEKNARRKLSSNYYFVIMFVSLLFLITFVILEILKSQIFN
ncbi:MAG: DUF3899 domain-containing protein [Bacilli bacterium]|nr:DUF3899 domain-containing protein [Bacilli bacterium]